MRRKSSSRSWPRAGAPATTVVSRLRSAAPIPSTTPTMRAPTAAGIRVGAYHRAFTNGTGRRQVRRDAEAEARVFLDSVGELQAGDLPPALDVESPFDGLKPRGLRRWIRVWLKRVERRLGRKPIVYTNATSWAQTGDTLSFARRGHPLWVANWDVPSAPRPGRQLGRGELDDLAVHELGLGARDRRARRPQLAARRLRGAQRRLTGVSRAPARRRGVPSLPRSARPPRARGPRGRARPGRDRR